MDDVLKHFQNSKCNKMGSKKSSFNGNMANGNTTTNSISTNKKIMNANNKFWTKISKAENSEGDEDTESEEDGMGIVFCEFCLLINIFFVAASVRIEFVLTTPIIPCFAPSSRSSSKSVIADVVPRTCDEY